MKLRKYRSRLIASSGLLVTPEFYGKGVFRPTITMQFPQPTLSSGEPLPPQSLDCHSPVQAIRLLGFILQIVDGEQLHFAAAPEYPVGYFAKELLQDAGDGEDRVVVDVHQTARLQEVDELLHGALVAGGAEYIAPVRRLLVQLQDENEQGSWNVVVVLAHLLQRHPELDLLQAVRIGGGGGGVAAGCDHVAQIGGTPVDAFSPAGHDFRERFSLSLTGVCLCLLGFS